MTTMVGVLVEYRAKTQQIDAAMDKMSKQIDTLKGKQDQATKGFDGMGDGVKRLTKAFAAMVSVTAILGFFKAVNAEVIQFSAALADLGAITGATGKDLEFLASASKSLSATTLSSASEIAEAFKLVGSVKADLLDNLPALRQTTEEVIKLSTASGVDLATAAKAVGQALNQFGAGADQAARFVNVMAAGAKFGASEVEDTAQALSFAGTVASQAGLSFEQLNAALQGLAQDGITATRAGTGLRAVLLKLQGDSDTSINPAVVGLSTALENLAAKNLTTTELTKKFGVVNITAANSLIKNRREIDALTKSMTGTNTAAEQASVITNSYAAKVTKLGNAWGRLKLAIGETVEIKGGIDALAASTNTLADATERLGLAKGILQGAVQSAFDLTIRPTSLLGNLNNAGSGPDDPRLRNRSVIPQIPEFPKALKSVERALESMIPPIGKLVKKVDAVGDFLGDLIKTQGQDKLKEILGSDNSGNKIEQKDDPVFNAAIKRIYEKAIGGTGGVLQSGTFNGKSFNNQTTTAGQDLSSLKDSLSNRLAGRDSAQLTSYIGAVDELSKLIQKIDPKNNKVNLNIEVKTEEGFLLKIAQSETLQNNMKEGILKMVNDAAGMGAK